MKEKPSFLGAASTIVSLFLIASLVSLIALAAKSLIAVGGFCAEGGPYVIAQHCPKGAGVVLAAGLPMLFVLGFVYMIALPKNWRPLLSWGWPLLFVSLAAAFFYGAFAATASFQIAPFFVGLLMLAIGVGPLAMRLLGKKEQDPGDPYPDRKDAALLQAIAGVLGLAAGVLCWTLLLG